MKVVRVFSMIVLVSILSCQEEEVNLYDGNYLIFGHFYGECLGETCVETYLHEFMDRVNATIRLLSE